MDSSDSLQLPTPWPAGPSPKSKKRKSPTPDSETRPESEVGSKQPRKTLPPSKTPTNWIDSVLWNPNARKTTYANSFKVALELLSMFSCINFTDFKAIPSKYLVAFISYAGEHWEKIINTALMCQNQLRTPRGPLFDYCLSSMYALNGCEFRITDNEIKFWTEFFQRMNVPIEEFVKTLKEWLNMTHMKKNVLWLYGSPNAGKTFFAMQILYPLMSVMERISNQGLAQEFALSNLLDCSCMLWEEPICDPTVAQDMKSVMGGMNITVAKKFSARQTLMRKPLLITSNYSDLTHGVGYSNIEAQALDARRFFFTVPGTMIVDEIIPADSFWSFIQYCVEIKGMKV